MIYISHEGLAASSAKPSRGGHSVTQGRLKTGNSERQFCRNNTLSQVVGLQFHHKTTPDSLEAFVVNCIGELIRGSPIQMEQELRQVEIAAYNNSNDIMNKLLTYVRESLWAKR